MDPVVGGCLALLRVEALEENFVARARELAARLEVSPSAGVKLLIGERGLGLAFADSSRGKPYYLDFSSSSWRARFERPLARSHIFRRALGSSGGMLVDATAGFGQDAVMALTLGFSVTAIERSPVVHEVLQDAIARAGAGEDEILRPALQRLRLICGEARELLRELSPDVVYLDPMFEKPKKSAKSPKEMQLLQELLSPAPSSVAAAAVAAEEGELFAAAWEAARHRVVVKRPLKARALKAGPTHSYKGQSIRYDVYVKS